MIHWYFAIQTSYSCNLMRIHVTCPPDANALFTFRNVCNITFATSNRSQPLPVNYRKERKKNHLHILKSNIISPENFCSKRILSFERIGLLRFSWVSSKDSSHLVKSFRFKSMMPWRVQPWWLWKPWGYTWLGWEYHILIVVNIPNGTFLKAKEVKQYQWRPRCLHSKNFCFTALRVRNNKSGHKHLRIQSGLVAWKVLAFLIYWACLTIKTFRKLYNLSNNSNTHI